jgi:hypothetical protein
MRQFQYGDIVRWAETGQCGRVMQVFHSVDTGVYCVRMEIAKDEKTVDVRFANVASLTLLASFSVPSARMVS